jgi:hypothetical protein
LLPKRYATTVPAVQKNAVKTTNPFPKKTLEHTQKFKPTTCMKQKRHFDTKNKQNPEPKHRHFGTTQPDLQSPAVLAATAFLCN